MLLRRHFWLGDRFRDRLGTDETSGEANVWPFHLGLVEDDAMLTAAIETLRREGFTTPYPLRFEAKHRADGLLLIYRLWSADYQTTTSWTSLGSIYLALLRRVDPAAARVQLDRMRALIERDGTFWEVLDGDGPAVAEPQPAVGQRPVDALGRDPARDARGRRIGRLTAVRAWHTTPR